MTEIRTPQLHHVTLKTRRPDEMIDWYGKTIGARVNFQWEGGAFMTVDRANHRMALIAIPILEERLKIPNQTSTVQALLDQARSAAGEAAPPPADEKPGEGPKPKPEKPPKPPKPDEGG